MQAILEAKRWVPFLVSSALETSVTTSGSIYLDEYIIGLENSNYYKKINDLLPIQNSEIHLKFKS